MFINMITIATKGMILYPKLIIFWSIVPGLFSA